MYSNPKPVPQDDFGCTTDEDLPISQKLGRLQSLQYRHFFEKDKDAQNGEESPIAKLDFANFIKPNPFHKSISNITDATTADTLGKTLTILDYSKSKSQSLSETQQPKSARGGLKSKNKAKYLKWHEYMIDCERQGVVPNSKHLQVKFTLPYFRKGQETASAQWDQTRWKEEEQWWEGEDWRQIGTTYSKPV